MTSYWWVNHKQTFKHEIEGGYLWSPKFKSNDDRNYFYDTMADGIGVCVGIAVARLIDRKWS